MGHYDWEAVVAETRRRPFVWLPLFPDHPAHLVYQIRQRRHRVLRREDGRLEATIVNKYKIPGFVSRGDIWVRWVTTNGGRDDDRGQADTDHGP